MARNDTGKWVSRAAATGGSRTYGSRRPTNYYLALLVVLVLGLASIALARSSYQNPSSKQAVEPEVGKTWYAGYAISVCGTPQAPLAANASSTTGQTTLGDGVVKITPTEKANAGNNATVGKFVSGYAGFAVSSSAMTVPGSTQATGGTPTSLAASGTTYQRGDSCPAGTPQAGKKGVVKVTYWPTLTTKKGKDITASYQQQKWAQNGLVTFSFGAAGAKVDRPSQSTISAMIQGGQGATPSTGITSTTTITPGTVPAPVTPTTKP